MSAVEIPDEAYIVAVGAMGWDVSAPVYPRLTDAIEAASPLVIAAYLEGPFSEELQRRADARAQIGEDDGAEDSCEDEGYDCHTAAAVATWLRARTVAKAHAIELRGGAS